MNLTEEWYAEYLAKVGKTSLKSKKANKYHARKTWLDGIAFDSQKEADFYASLKLLHRAGEIDGFLHHGRMVCAAGTDKEHRATLYETDFVILLPGERYEIVDTKGVETDVFKLKIKTLREKYPNVKIRTE